MTKTKNTCLLPSGGGGATCGGWFFRSSHRLVLPRDGNSWVQAEPVQTAVALMAQWWNGQEGFRQLCDHLAPQ